MHQEQDISKNFNFLQNFQDSCCLRFGLDNRCPKFLKLQNLKKFLKTLNIVTKNFIACLLVCVCFFHCVFSLCVFSLSECICLVGRLLFQTMSLTLCPRLDTLDALTTTKDKFSSRNIANFDSKFLFLFSI